MYSPSYCSKSQVRPLRLKTTLHASKGGFPFGHVARRVNGTCEGIAHVWHILEAKTSWSLHSSLATHSRSQAEPSS